MFDHVGINVSDLERSRRFYAAALGPLGILLMEQFEGAHVIAFGRDQPQFWVAQGDTGTSAHGHIAFACTSRLEVDAFQRAALQAGGSDHGAPGLRPHYHPNYYGAFVLDPDGYNIEAVCHRPE